MSLSFNDWSTTQRLEDLQDEAASIDYDRFEAILEANLEKNKISEIEIPTENIKTRNCVVMDSVKNLCRVCSSNGLISITQPIGRVEIKYRREGDQNKFNIPIGKAIEEISGEKVSPDDSLPQFICEHCLGYLKHAFEMRVKIQSNTASLKEALQIAGDDSIPLETSTIDQSRITKRELKDVEEEVTEDQHFYKHFQGAAIQIKNPTVMQRTRMKEYNCPGCNSRLTSVETFEQHKQQCTFSAVSDYLGKFQAIYSMKCENKITEHEFILREIREIFQANDELRKLAKGWKLPINAVAPLPPKETDQTQKPFFKRPGKFSPDQGYTSGDKANTSQW